MGVHVQRRIDVGVNACLSTFLPVRSRARVGPAAPVIVVRSFVAIRRGLGEIDEVGSASGAEESISALGPSVGRSRVFICAPAGDRG